ncbi:MAG: CapA family protein [Chloroflexi bacterium]|nr:CapA family protein [Chloroflexota bacterium]
MFLPQVSGEIVRRGLAAIALASLLLSGCTPLAAGSDPGNDPTPAASAMPSSPAATATAIPRPMLWIDPAVPVELRQAIQLPAGVQLAENPQEATLQFGVQPAGQGQTRWVYALVAPFPTVPDGVRFEDLRAYWQGRGSSDFGDQPLLLSASTRDAFAALWGAPASGVTQVVPSGSLLERAWAQRPSWALIPFEEIEPRWKVLRVDGVSPLDGDFDLAEYPLVVDFGLQGDGTASQPYPSLAPLPAGNRDPQKLTVLVMTGVTALVRATAARMEEKGMTYPGQDVRTWLRQADLTHISNEVSFDTQCPPANPDQTNLMFCSRPEYLQLLEDVGADIIELSGNHLLDWRVESLRQTLDLYRQNGMRYYAAGENLQEARQPLLVEHNGNRLAFLGCNPAGPPSVWASDDRPGVADCDYDWMRAEIGRLRQEGYLPIVTLQYFETYSSLPTVNQDKDFQALAEAGAVIVSGSQAHVPQTMTFAGQSFIHYGLGNLFFDQMKVWVEDRLIEGTRDEFIDRHVFYDGRYLGSELLTAVLEDYARPRPTTPAERAAMLEKIFAESGW